MRRRKEGPNRRKRKQGKYKEEYFRKVHGKVKDAERLGADCDR